MKVLAILMTVAALSYSQAAVPTPQEHSLVPALETLFNCFHKGGAKSVYYSILALRQEKHGAEFADNMASLLEKVPEVFAPIFDYLQSQNLDAQRLVQALSLAFHTKQTTNEKVNFDIFDSECLLTKMLHLLETDEAVQNLFTELSRPRTLKSFKIFQSLPEAQKLSQMLRQAGFDIDLVTETMNSVFNNRARQSTSSVSRFAQAVYGMNKCANCPACTACLQCCRLKEYF